MRGESVEGPAAAAAETKKAARKKRVPKGITPGVSPAPDPERWLKKTERSWYVPPRGKRRGGGGATQGFTPAATVEGASAPGTGGGGGGGGKKKGKKKSTFTLFLGPGLGLGLVHVHVHFLRAGTSRPLASF